ncbi:rhodanese-like domain-containing protein [Candidatus Saccharibacteria bacterium]|nr:rhodanese-like domain-containing protein [Candidatus Saccharibacteria bacterium]
MQNNRKFIDVREPIEFMFGHVEGALNIPPAKLMAGAKELKDLPKDTQLILYCMSGSRSAAAMNILKQLGYTNLENGINKDQVKAKYFAKS